MQLTIHLPDDLGRRVTELPDPEAFIAAAVAKAIGRLRRKESAVSLAPSRWARLVDRLEADPVHLDGYGEQLKRDVREFRNGFAFKHDRQS